MKLLTSITTIIAAASARQIYDHHAPENYANSAEIYQSALEHQQQGLYNGQSQAYAAHEAARQERPSAEKTARILSYVSENNDHGYKYAYETENGIKAQEASQTAEHGHAAHGGYSYTGDDGHVYTVEYVADGNGFRAQGAHLPTPPPIPEEILKSLEQNAKDEAAGIYDDGNYKEHSHQVYQKVQQPYQQVQQSYQLEQQHSHQLAQQHTQQLAQHQAHQLAQQHAQHQAHQLAQQHTQQQANRLAQHQAHQLAQQHTQQQAHQQQYQAPAYHTGNYRQQYSAPVQVAHGADLAYRGHH